MYVILPWKEAKKITLLMNEMLRDADGSKSQKSSSIVFPYMCVFIIEESFCSQPLFIMSLRCKVNTLKMTLLQSFSINIFSVPSQH